MFRPIQKWAETTTRVTRGNKWKKAFIWMPNNNPEIFIFTEVIMFCHMLLQSQDFDMSVLKLTAGCYRCHRWHSSISLYLWLWLNLWLFIEDMHVQGLGRTRNIVFYAGCCFPEPCPRSTSSHPVTPQQHPAISVLFIYRLADEDSRGLTKGKKSHDSNSFSPNSTSRWKT